MIHAVLQAIDASVLGLAEWARKYPRRIVALSSTTLMLGTGATFAVATFGPDAANLPVQTIVEPVRPVAQAQQVLALQEDSHLLYRSDITRSTDTADSLLKRMGVADIEAAAFIRSDTLVLQNVLGRAGRNVTVEASDDQRLVRLLARWSPEDDGMFKRLTVEKSAQGWQSRLETLPMTVSARLASGTISSSLFAATDESRIPDAVAIQMAEIFSGDIDFHRALRKGDRFSVVYETLEGDGEPLRAGRVLSSEFVNAGKTFQAMWFQPPAAGGAVAQSTASHSLTKGGYYTLSGESLRRAFLASPMEFSRVTSGFAMRFHPILQTWRAHLGVDYGAPTGTPVRSVGDGVVEFAGVQGGYGNVVIVRHANNHTTLYAHLSKIHVNRGQNVNQGQFVGLVGATGWATGPHLHFEFRVNGVHRDPVTIARQSESVPVAAALKPQFAQAASMVRQQLLAAAVLNTGSVQ